MTVTPSHWQDLTRDCGLMLHGAFGDFRAQLPSLQTEYARLDRDADPSLRDFRANDGSWSSLLLIHRPSSSSPSSPGTASSGLALMPTLAHLLERAGWAVLSAHILRQPPGGVLPWHYENQAPYSAETRLLLPLHAPARSRTLVGHEAVAYPEGIGWVADVNMPHQVENPGDDQRIILVIDVISDQGIRRLFPPPLLADLPRRNELAARTQALLLAWRQQ